MEYQFNAEDQEKRNKWLLTTKMFYIGAPLALGIVQLAHYFLDRTQSKELLEAAVYLLLSSFSYLLLKQSAYKKYSRAFMAFSICAAGLSLALYPMLYKADICWLVNCGLYAWWVYACTKLWAINKKAGLWRASLVDFQRSVKEFKGAKNLTELNKLYKATIKKWPEYESWAHCEYEDKRAVLEKPTQTQNILASV